MESHIEKQRIPGTAKKTARLYIALLVFFFFALVFYSINSVAINEVDNSLPKVFELKDLLHTHANKEKFVMLTAFTLSYKEMLLSFKCNLDRVGMTDHLIYAAFDEKVFDWGTSHNLPIFLVPGLLDDNTTEIVGGAFNTAGFKTAARAKTLAVLSVLEAGYSVVWSDVDIVWFENPFNALSSCMAETNALCIQSDSPLGEDPTNMLNSGMYVAPNSPLIKAAFRDIVQHQSHHDLDDQKSFNEILCRSHSIKLQDVCIYRPSPEEQHNLLLVDSSVSAHILPVKTLDRLQYPNGAVRVGIRDENIFQLGTKEFTTATSTKVIMAHNNWIVGIERKKARLNSSGWWFIDGYGICTLTAF